MEKGPQAETITEIKFITLLANTSQLKKIKEEQEEAKEMGKKCD